MTGATLKWREYAHPYLNFVPNAALNDVACDNLQALGLQVDRKPRDLGVGLHRFRQCQPKDACLLL